MDTMSLLSPREIEHYWPSLCEELQKVPHIWNQCWTLDALKTGIDLGQFQLWGCGSEQKLELMLFTKSATFPAATILEVFLAVGNQLDRLLPVIVATLHRFAFENKCQRVDICGRFGWERKLREIGFRRDHVVLSYDVPDITLQ